MGLWTLIKRISLACFLSLVCLPGQGSRSYAAEHSSIAQIVGDPSLRSVMGYPLEILTTSNQSDKNCDDCQRVYIQAALHGDESLTTEFALWLFSRIEEGKSPINKIPTHLAFDFLPKANPDSFSRSRYNAHGVNLNRNFGTFWGISREPNGSSPFSEPETRAIKKILEKNSYVLAVDIHGYASWVVTPSDAKFSALSGRLALYHKWIQSIRSERRLLGNYSIWNGVELGDGGAFEDWAFWEVGSLAFCLEIEPENRGANNKEMFEKYEAFLSRMIEDALSLKAGHGPAPAHPIATR